MDNKVKTAGFAGSADGIIRKIIGDKSRAKKYMFEVNTEDFGWITVFMEHYKKDLWAISVHQARMVDLLNNEEHYFTFYMQSEKVKDFHVGILNFKAAMYQLMFYKERGFFNVGDIKDIEAVQDGDMTEDMIDMYNVTIAQMKKDEENKEN